MQGYTYIDIQEVKPMCAGINQDSSLFLCLNNLNVLLPFVHLGQCLTI